MSRSNPARRAQRESHSVPRSVSKKNSPASGEYSKAKHVSHSIEHNPELRALTTFSRLGPEHRTFLVREDGAAPHLRVGEYAVVDTSDRAPQHGELYVIQYPDGERPRKIVQTRSDNLRIGDDKKPSLVWWLGDLRGYRDTGEVVCGTVPLFAGLSDGPYRTEKLQRKLLGRVVGVAAGSLDGLLDPAAGWQNEAAGNAAFDPAEYVDTLLRTGHRPGVMTDRNGVLVYYEKLPGRPLTKQEHAAVFAIRTKYCAASGALDRVIAECAGRGLTERRRAA